jgi:hypothetical protein
MAIDSISGLQVGAWGQMQQQQAERAAVQAEEKARTLRSQADSARATADRAQENARQLKVQSDQAQGDASNALQNVAAMKSLGALRSQFDNWHAQLTTALATNAKPAATTAQPQPVLNALGQTTGSVLSVTA